MVQWQTNLQEVHELLRNRGMYWTFSDSWTKVSYITGHVLRSWSFPKKIRTKYWPKDWIGSFKDVLYIFADIRDFFGGLKETQPLWGKKQQSSSSQLTKRSQYTPNVNGKLIQGRTVRNYWHSGLKREKVKMEEKGRSILQKAPIQLQICYGDFILIFFYWTFGIRGSLVESILQVLGLLSCTSCSKVAAAGDRHLKSLEFCMELGPLLYNCRLFSGFSFRVFLPTVWNFDY